VASLTNVPQAETKAVLTILNLDTNQKVDIADGTGAAFSADSMWIAYTVEPGGGGRGGRGGGRAGGGGGGGAPGGGGGQAPQPTPLPARRRRLARRDTAPPTPPRHVELRSLAGGTLGPVARQWQDIQAFAFSPKSTHLVLRRRPATAARGCRGSRRSGYRGARPQAAVVLRRPATKPGRRAAWT
jgi:hypothetical protein